MTNKSFNTSETCFLISPYPHKGETYSAGLTGVASYAKNTVTNMKRPVIVLGQKQNGYKAYCEKNTLVMRVWQQNSLSMWIHIFHAMRRFPNVKNVLLQFDFGMYGSIIATSLVIPFLTLLKIYGYRVHVVNHHVVNDVHAISGHIGLGTGWKDGLRATIYNGIFHTFYRILGVLSEKVIVLEKALEETMRRYMNEKSVMTIPHAIDPSEKAVRKSDARRKLGIARDEEVVLFFGYVNWFKGADIFAKTFRNRKTLLGKKARFIIAGGRSPTMKTRDYYQKYYESVEKTVYGSATVDITGYVKQEEIALYFSAADIVVFPYRAFMCASGVLSLAFSFEKPFILSHALAGFLRSPDITEALEEARLEKTDLLFSLTKKSFGKAVERVLKNGLKDRMRHCARLLRERRAFYNNARFYDALLEETVAPTLRPAYTDTI